MSTAYLLKTSKPGLKVCKSCKVFEKLCIPLIGFLLTLQSVLKLSIHYIVWQEILMFTSQTRNSRLKFILWRKNLKIVLYYKRKEFLWKFREELWKQARIKDVSKENIHFYYNISFPSAWSLSFLPFSILTWDELNELGIFVVSHLITKLMTLHYK